MAMLNDYTPETARNIHLLTTSLCDRDCPHCCNKQYDLSTIPQVSKEELRHAKNIFLTGGEPFTFSQPAEIADWLKCKYKNIEKVIVYTGAYELYSYLARRGSLWHIDGLTVSLKEYRDKDYFEGILTYLKDCSECNSNRLYYFGEHLIEGLDTTGFEVFAREWQPNFIPAPDSIFRRI